MLPFINGPLSGLAEALGASLDELKLILSFLLSYPLAAVLKRIPDSKPYQKNLFIIGVSLFYLVGLFDLWDGIRTIAISGGVTYAITAYVKGPYMPWMGFIFLMGHMSMNHIYRQIMDDPGVIDITGAQMVLVMKLTAFCWNVYDGQLPENELADVQKERAVRQLPGLLEYTAYVLFFPSLFAGPAFDYVDYQRWIETSMFELPPGTDPAQAPKVRKKRKIPRSGTPAFIKAVTGIGWILMFIQLSSWYNNDLVLGEAFKDYAFLHKVWVLQMLGFTARLKYYGVWTLTEGACILSGLGYKGVDPKTGRVDWNRLRNVDAFGVELAQNSRAYLGNWNMNTNNWLRNYIYLRVTPKGKKPGFRASLATFTTSAFWHGFYPGYYLSFLLAAFIQTVAKNFRHLVRPFFLTPDGSRPTKLKPCYDVASYLATQTIFAFTTAPFVLLTLQNSLLVWSRVYFYAVLAVGGSIALFNSPLKAQLIKQLKQYQKTAPPRPADLKWQISHDGSPILGMPSDPAAVVDEAVKEISEEVEMRRRKGSQVKMPQGEELVRELKGRVKEKTGVDI